MQIGETFELGGGVYAAAAQAADPTAKDGSCTGCAFTENPRLCGKAGPCDEIIFVPAARPLPDYSPILAGILAGKQIQYIRPDGTFADQQNANATYHSMAAAVPAAWLRVKPDTWVVNGVELPTPVEFERGAPSPTGLPAYAFVGYVAHENQIPPTVRRWACATADEAKALYEAITSSLPKAPT